MRNNNGNSTFLIFCRFYHVSYKCPVALAFWRNTTGKPSIWITCCIFCTPFIQTKRRICNNNIKLHKAFIAYKKRIVDCISPFNPCTIKTVKKHIHTAKSPGTSICFLSKQCKIASRNLICSFYKKASRTTSWIANCITVF